MEQLLPVTMNGGSGSVFFEADKNYLIRRFICQGSAGLQMQNTMSASAPLGVTVGLYLVSNSLGSTVFQTGELNYPLQKGERVWQVGSGTITIFLLDVAEN